MNEVAVFVPSVDQFEGGESAYECVAFSASLIFYSTAPFTTNNWTAENVDQLADVWYAKEEGDYSSSNTNGMSLPALYDMLDGMGLTKVVLPVDANSQHTNDMLVVAQALQKGYPVILCGAETGFLYANGDAVPYTWSPTGNHAIVATKIMDSGNFGVRDMAALANGNVPGSLQEYDNNKMFLISATAIIPTWIGVPTPVTSPNKNVVQAAQDTWNSTAYLFGGTPLPYTTGIAQSWQDIYVNHLHNMPPPTTREFASVDWAGRPIVVQMFGILRCEWFKGAASWYVANGAIR